jgi:hypothetical protein
MAGPRGRRAFWLALALCAAHPACVVPNPAYTQRVDDPSSTLPSADAAPASADGRLDSARDVADAGSRADGGFTPNASTAPSDPAGTCPQRPELALCLRFEGSVTDESPNHLPLTVRDVSLVSGRTGSAANVGATSQISVADGTPLDLTTATVEGWWKPRALGRGMGLFDDNGQYGIFMQPSGLVECIGSGGGSPWPSGGPLVAGTWTSVACTWDSAASTLWIDGLEVATRARTGPLHTDSTDAVTIGADGPQGNPFDGAIDNVRVWREVRTPAQLCAAAPACH